MKLVGDKGQKGLSKTMEMSLKGFFKPFQKLSLGHKEVGAAKVFCRSFYARTVHTQV